MQSFPKICVLIVALTIIFSSSALAASKIMYVDSYHEGYAWSDGILKSIENALAGKDIELQIIHMDTKRHAEESFIKEAAKKAHMAIESFKPDIVIASDDNASKYLIVPYFLNSSLPVVVCGINWDASAYGFPAKNVTGMIEVTPIAPMVKTLKSAAKGNRIGFIGPETLTSRKELEYSNKAMGVKMDAFFATNLEEWKKGFVALQKRTDMVIIDSDGGLYDDQADQLAAFVEKTTSVPTGSGYDFMKRYAVVVYGKSPQEQGEWAAKTALEVLNGTDIGSIPMVKSQEGDLIVNLRLMKAADVTLPDSVMKAALKIMK